MGPANMEDLSNPDLYDHIQASEDFRLHFSKTHGAQGEFEGSVCVYS